MLNGTGRIDQGIPCQACLCPGISNVRSMLLLLGNKPLWPVPPLHGDAASDTRLSEMVFFFWSFTTTMPLPPRTQGPMPVTHCAQKLSPHANCGFRGFQARIGRGERLDPVAESVSATADRILSCDNEAASVINCLHQPQPSILPIRSLRCFSSSQVTHPLIQHRATRFEIANLRLHRNLHCIARPLPSYLNVRTVRNTWKNR